MRMSGKIPGTGSSGSSTPLLNCMRWRNFQRRYKRRCGERVELVDERLMPQIVELLLTSGRRAREFENFLQHSRNEESNWYWLPGQRAEG